MVVKYASTDDAEKPADGFIVECDCCGRRMDAYGVARANDGCFDIFEDREYAHELSEDTGWMVDVRGTVAICQDCQTEISMGHVRIKHADEGGHCWADRVRESLKEGGVE